MNLIFVSATYMPAAGGAEISMYTLLRHLAMTDCVTVLTREPCAAEPRFGQAVNIRIRTAPDRATVPRRLAETIAEQRADAILTQNAWSDLAMSVAKSARIPLVYFARSADGTGAFTRSDQHRCDLIISNSRAVAAFIEERWGRTSRVILSPIAAEDYTAGVRTGDSITMVNPIEMKGGRLVVELAQLLPERRFLVVRGWNHLRNGAGWDLALMRDLAEGCGVAASWDPADTDFSHHSNVTVLDHCDDMRTVYARTRLLLVPSLRHESCPRVAIEALCSGIPIIGSKVGGIPDAIGAAGSIVEDYHDAARWAAAIGAYDDPDTYHRAALAAQVQIARHDPVGIARSVRDALTALLTQSALVGYA